MSQLNLRTLLSGDNLGDVVEKLNYNFQQIVLNGGGPVGDTGLIGPPGIPGPEGPTGPIGPTGGTGTYVYAGPTAPNSLTNLVPTPRDGDLYIQPDSISGLINFWEKTGTGATGWVFLTSISASDGIFTTAEPTILPGVDNTAAYPRLNKASLLLISDYDSLTLDQQILQDFSGIKKIHGWLDQSWVPWQAMFGGLRNQIRLLNTDPDITGPIAAATRNDYGAGMMLSLETILGTSDQILAIGSADNALITQDKFFRLAVNKGTTASIVTDRDNRVVIYSPQDITDPINQGLNDSLTVIGTGLVYDAVDATLRVGTLDSISSFSRFKMTKAGGLTASGNGTWEWRLGNSLDATDYSLRLFGTESARNAQILSLGVSILDDRGSYTPQVGIGMDGAIAELEVGKHVSGRAGVGQISPYAANNYAAGYYSFNAFRERGNATTSQWALRGDSTFNGGIINWGSSDGKTFSFLLMPSTNGANRLISGDSFLKTESSITMKRVAGSATKLFIDSFAYTELGDSAILNSPQLVIGVGTTSSPAQFNFGSSASGIGLHGISESIEWLSGQSGSNSTGFRFISGTGDAGPNLLTTHKMQYRSYVDSNWKTSITIISQDGATGGSHSGNVIIGDAVPSSTVGKAKLTVVGASGPTGGATGPTSPFLGSPQIVDFQTAGGTSMFALSHEGNVVAGLRFGNSYYDSPDLFTLDHYQEGTWTPTLETDATFAGFDSSNLKVFKSNFTRVGNKVKVDFALRIEGLTAQVTGPTGTSLYITGFPFRPDFERVSGVGSEVDNPDNPCYPMVPLKSVGIKRGSSSMFGEVKTFAGADSSIPPGWLLCNGQEVLKTDYPDLYATIGDTYGIPSPSSSLYFRVPDLRGLFVRGLNTSGTGIDQFRALGSTQSDMFKSHTHTATGNYYLYDIVGRGNLSIASQDAVANEPWNRSQNAISSTGGIETRPANIALNYIIYAGIPGNANLIEDITGGFVLDGGVRTRLYLYDSLSTLEVSNLPYGSSSYSMLFGSFEYFVSSTQSLPIVMGGDFVFNIGD